MPRWDGCCGSWVSTVDDIRVSGVRGADAASTDVPAEPEPTVASETIATWRKRLGSLSWFMRTLLEPRMHAPLRQGSSLGAMHAVRP